MRFRRVHAAMATFVLVAAVVVTAALLVDKRDSSGKAAEPIAFVPSGVPTESGQASPTARPTASPSASRSSKPKASPSPSPSPKPKSSPSRKPVAIEGPPPPPPTQSSPHPSAPSCPYYDGVNESKAAVGAALDAAAARRFWTTSQVVLPVNLIKAVAMQESGWQSAIIACDGGIGTMQVMPGTATWMNNRFGTNYDVNTLSGNTMIGSAYLQWLIKYFGDVYFGGDYAIRADDCSQDPDLPDHREPCLLNAVIASYNYGFGAVDDADNGRIVIPNPRYVENVRALMQNY